MKNTLYLALVAILCLFACKDPKSSQKTTTDQSSLPKPVIVGELLPPAPESFIFEMYEKVDYIDYLFRNTNFSVSQGEKEAVQSIISTLSPSSPKAYNPSCKSPIRMTYLSQGEIFVETEMYMTEGCLFVEYYIDNVKTYHNNYSEEGFNFLIGLINQAKTSAPPR